MVALCALAAIGISWQPASAVDVWSPNICVPIFEAPDYTGKDDPNARVRIVGARNGAFWGQVAVFSKEPGKGPDATISDLKTADGLAVIPASAVEIRYARPTGSERQAKRRFPDAKNLPRLEANRLPRFDSLWPVPQEQPTRTHLVCLKVKVPADAKPGRYVGQLAVADRRVPVELTVYGWKLPDTRDFITHVGIIQSPESVALQYKVPLWSDKHFELIGRSFDCLAPLGNKSIYIPLICQTHFGNSESMVRWVRDDEKFKHDFSIAEKYLDLYIQRIGRPKVVCFYVWDIFCGGGYFRDEGGKPPVGPSVTLLDPMTGHTEAMTGPVQGTPEAETFWKPGLDGLRERLAKRGLGDKTFIIGIAQDVRPSRDVTAMFQRIAPYARWAIHSHSSSQNIGAVIGFRANVYTAHVPDPDKPPVHSWWKRYYYGWNQDRLIVVFPRDGGSNAFINPPLWGDAPLAVHHQILEGALSANQRGIDRIGADFWPVLAGERRRRPRSIINRYPASSWNQLSVSTAVGSVLHPGPAGALPTWRLELIREGLQECEAKIFIEKALLDKSLRARLGEELAGRCEQLLKERVRTFRIANPMYYEVAERKGWDWWVNESGWPQQSERLFALATEVAKALGRE